ncbi:MAG TPA: hypothetical protein VMY99_02990 [Nevskiaceae bacterium]|nr:hypothetical protein [Nevskiaceae bacterium]
MEDCPGQYVTLFPAANLPDGEAQTAPSHTPPPPPGSIAHTLRRGTHSYEDITQVLDTEEKYIHTLTASIEDSWGDRVEPTMRDLAFVQAGMALINPVERKKCSDTLTDALSMVRKNVYNAQTQGKLPTPQALRLLAYLTPYNILEDQADVRRVRVERTVALFQALGGALGEPVVLARPWPDMHRGGTLVSVPRIEVDIEAKNRAQIVYDVEPQPPRPEPLVCRVPLGLLALRDVDSQNVHDASGVFIGASAIAQYAATTVAAQRSVFTEYARNNDIEVSASLLKAIGAVAQSGLALKDTIPPNDIQALEQALLTIFTRAELEKSETRRPLTLLKELHTGSPQEFFDKVRTHLRAAKPTRLTSMPSHQQWQRVSARYAILQQFTGVSEPLV